MAPSLSLCDFIIIENALAQQPTATLLRLLPLAACKTPFLNMRRRVLVVDRAGLDPSVDCSLHQHPHH